MSSIELGGSGVSSFTLWRGLQKQFQVGLTNDALEVRFVGGRNGFHTFYNLTYSLSIPTERVVWRQR